MAKRVTTEDIQLMNELYYKYKSYAEVARQTGWASSTVTKYIDKNYTPIIVEEIERFNPSTDLPEFSTDVFQGDWAELCSYTELEAEEIVLLWRELPI